MAHTVKVKVNNKWYTVDVENIDIIPILATVDGETVEIDVQSLEVTDRVERTQISKDQEETEPIESPINPEDIEEGEKSSTPVLPRIPTPVKAFRAPMPGVIISVAVKVADQIITGDEICVLEAMKMRQSLRADWSGIVKQVHVVSGQQVHDGDLIIELE